MQVLLFNNGPVAVDDFRRALTIADPEIDSEKMDAYVFWTFRCKRETMGDAEPMDQARLLQRFRNGNVKRVGKKM